MSVLRAPAGEGVVSLPGFPGPTPRPLHGIPLQFAILVIVVTFGARAFLEGLVWVFRGFGDEV